MAQMTASFLRGNILLSEQTIKRIRKCAFVNREIIYDHAKTYENNVQFDWIKPGIEGMLCFHNFKNIPGLECEGHITLCIADLKTMGLETSSPGRRRDNQQVLDRVREYLLGMMYWDITWGTERGDWARLIGEPNGVFFSDNKLFLDYRDNDHVDAILSRDATDWLGDDEFETAATEGEIE